MREIRNLFLGLTTTALLITAPGCKPAESEAQSPQPADTTAASATESTELASATEPDAGTPDEATPTEGNVITRNLPRFHDAFESDQAFVQWMETFYVHKEYEKTPQAIGYYCSSELFEDYESRIPMSAFFGAILEQSDETVDLCYDELMLEGRVSELTVLGYAAWFADTEHSRQMIFRAREIWKHESLVRMFHLIHRSKIVDTMERNPEEDPRVMLMLWFEYFATGDEDRLRRAVEHAFMHNAPEGTWQRNAGQFSHTILERMLPHDSRTRGVAEEMAITTESPAIRNYLTRAIEQAGPLRPRPGITPAS